MTFKKLVAVFVLGSALATDSMARCADTELYGYMETMRDNLQVITRNVRGGNMDAVRDEASELVWAVEASTPEIPYALSNGNAADIEDYRAMMEDLLAVAQRLETAVQAGDQTMATNALNEMSQLRRTGHGRFKARSC